ncbi:methylmalonyl-CoA mutase family protein [Metabacillus sp. Hm71]|uniref:methylmalonyl-CoA mutase family protein n=1 Tax=Metabacillus sp. Hm71 TaxID=3450743 RepID=UPI003F43945B
MGDGQGTAQTKGKWNAWKAEAEKALKGKGIESLYSPTYEGITLKPLYVKEDIKIDTQTSIRGYRKHNEWRVSQVLLGNDHQTLSERIKYAKVRGQDSFYLKNFSFLDNKQDIAAAFQHLDWEQDSIFFDVGEKLEFIPSFLHYLKESQNVKVVKGLLGFDPYESILLKGKNSIALSTQYDFLADCIKWCQKNQSSIRTILIKGNLYHEAGGHSIQELVYTFSHALDVINELLNRGLSITTIAKSITFTFAVGSHFFMEIAKLRAAKQIWASLLHALGGDEASPSMYLHAVTSLFNKAAYDVHVNLLRTTTEGFAAAAAGVDELTILPFDSVFVEAGGLAERIARNTQFILKEESLISRVVDPAAGAYYVEALTSELAEKAWKEIVDIDENGGFLSLLTKGTPQKELKKIAETRILDVNKQKTKIIGINAFANLEDKALDKRQVKNDSLKNQSVIDFPSFVEAWKTLNDSITSQAKDEQELHHIQPLTILRLAEHYEQLRFHSEAFEQLHGFKPTVTVMVFGRLKDYKPRLDFLTGLLASGGLQIDVVSSESDLATIKGNIMIFCGKDEDYECIDPLFINKLKAANDQVWLFIVGKGHETLIKQYEISDSITANMNAYEFLVTLHQLIGVSER